MQQYLENIYQRLLSKDQWKINNLLKKTETQGEILYESVSKIVSHLNISDQDCFLDIGSGFGKVVFQFFLLTPIKQSIGIEIIPELCYISSRVLKEIRKNFSNFFIDERKINFINADVLNINLPDQYTILFINSTCFSQSLLYQISQLIKNLSHLHTILTTRPLYFIGPNFHFQQSIAIECTWDTALCYVYKKINDINYNISLLQYE